MKRLFSLGLVCSVWWVGAVAGLPKTAEAVENAAAVLPMGSAPAPLDAAWFPGRLHALVWRNWSLVPPARLAAVVGAKPDDIVRVGRSMGLPTPRGLSETQRRRAALTIIRRNWHLLPYDQMLTLLDWTADELAYALREDDFLFHKLGLLKPKSEPLRWAEPTAAEAARAAEIAAVVREHFPAGDLEGSDPLFSFVEKLSAPLAVGSAVAPFPAARRSEAGDAPPLRLGYSYFALYGDPLMDPALDPYPDGYLARLAASGVNAVWLHAVLARLSPLPWAKEAGIEQRRAALRDLVARAARHGVKIFLYLNEPRALPPTSPVFAEHPDWRGVPAEGFNALCTSAAGVRDGLRAGIADLCRAVPDLGGFFAISASENLTNCWSKGRGADCPHCKERKPAAVIAEVIATFHEGIRAGRGTQRLVAWDWGWADAWATDAIAQLPGGVTLLSVSEWGLPLERGGIKTTVGEYSLSAIGPGPRALKHWATAQARGLPIAAKLQLGTTWECSAVPFIPAVDNVAQHLVGVRAAGVEDLMLGWTLGGHPSPNIAAVTEIFSGGSLATLAARRHGEAQAPAVVKFWQECSAAFREFPFHGSLVYRAPLQTGPANLLWVAPTGYKSTMVGFPYDDVDGWRAVYPAAVFAGQLEKVATGFDAAIALLRAALPQPAEALADEVRFAEVAAIHFASAVEQTRFVLARRAGDVAAMLRGLAAEMRLATRLHALQSRDSRLGFEASNQYYYVPLDLVEKVVNCRWVAEKIAPVTSPKMKDLTLNFETPTDAALQRQIEAIDARLRAKHGLAPEQAAVGGLDLRTGRFAAVRPDAIDYAASVPKIGILLAWMQTHPEAANALDAATRRELGKMIKVSDNELATKFSTQLGIARVQEVLNSYGLYDAAHGGGLWFGKHYGKGSERIGDPVDGHSHAATVRQLLRFYLLLEQGKLVTPEASAVMREIFASPEIAHRNDRFVKGLAGRGVDVRRKSGWWETWSHDTAVVTGPGRHYVLVAMTHHPKGATYLEEFAAAVDDVLMGRTETAP
jgi:hypothetical protein